MTKAMGAQLEADYSTKAVVPSAEGTTLAGAVVNEPVPAWQAASDERWWGSATADDLGRAWAAASAEAESGDPGAEKALAEMRRNVQEHWGLAVDQDGTVVDLTGPQAGPAVNGALSGGRDDQGAADAVGARVDRGQDASTMASPVVVPDTIEALIFSAHPLTPERDLAAAVGAGDPTEASLRFARPGGGARWRLGPWLNGRCLELGPLGPSLGCLDGHGVVASRQHLLCHARPGGTRRTLPRASRAPTPAVQAAATTRLRSGFPSGAAQGLCLSRLPRGQRASYQPSSTGQVRSTER